MKKSILLVLFTFFLLSLNQSCCNGCDDDGPLPPPVNPVGMVDPPKTETFELTTSKSEVFPFEVVSLETNIELNVSEYTGFLGDSEIQFIKNDTGGLSVVMPELAIGSYDFKITIDGKEGTTKISILQLQEIENIDEFITTNLQSEIDNSINQAKSLVDDSSNPDLFNEGISYLDEFNFEFEKLEPEQKRELAYFLKVNNINLGELASKNNSIMGKTFDFDSQVQPLLNGLLVSKSALVALISGIAIATYGGQPLIGLALVGIAIIKYNAVLDLRTSILDAITIPIANDLNELSGKSVQSKNKDLAFVNDSPKNFNVISKGRKLIKSDVNNSNQKIANTVSSLNETDDVIIDLQRKVQTIINVVGSFFSGKENKIEQTEELPEQLAEEIITVAFDKFFIGDLPSDIAVDIVALDANTLQIKFTSQTNEPTQFTANFIYDDGDFRTETALNVSLEKKEENNQVIADGTYKWEQAGDLGLGTCISSGQTSESTHILPKQVRFTNGKPFDESLEESGENFTRSTKNTNSHTITPTSFSYDYLLTIDYTSSGSGGTYTQHNTKTMKFEGTWNNELKLYEGLFYITTKQTSSSSSGSFSSNCNYGGTPATIEITTQ